MPVQYVEITDAEDAGQRLDNFLLRHLKGVPRQKVYRIVRKGEVRVNGGRVQAAYRVQVGDRIRIPPLRTAAEVPQRINGNLAQQLAAAVIYEDDDVLVLNKPAGVAVHGGSNVNHGVVETLRVHLANKRLELVHRLDRDTSGCLALAKNRRTLRLLQEEFRSRRVKKIYELYVWGLWPKHLSVVQHKLARYETDWGERRVRVDPLGQSARTDFTVLETCAAASRVQARLHTGRTHQIRVHALASGFPLVGDDKYATAETRRKPGFTAPRLCLHASRLVLPRDGSQLKLDAPLPDEMTDLWRQLLQLN